VVRFRRPELVDLEADDPVRVPVVRRAPLRLSDNLCSLFPTHKYTPTPFEPIPLEVLGPERRDPRAKRQPIPRHEGGAIPRPSTLRDRRQTREKQAMAS
jgi:hypothetical protein